MKILIQTFIIAVLAVGFIGCDKKSSNNSSGLPYDPYNPYDPRSPNQPNYNINSRLFYGSAQIIDQTTYRRFLRGDVCWSKGHCKRLDNQAEVFMQMSQTEIKENQNVFATFGVGVRSDRFAFFNETSVGRIQYPMTLRRVNNNSQFEGNAIDRYTKNGIGARLQVLGSGNPAQGSFSINVYYDGQPMLQAQMIRVR